MSKYNFRKFFKNTIVYNNEYISNGYFLVKTSILTKKQLQIIHNFSSNEELANKLIDNVLNPLVDKYGDKKGIKFIPNCIDKKSQLVYMVNNDRIIALTAEYYHWLVARKCNLYIVGEKTDPLFVYKDCDFIGIILPVRVHNFNVGDKIDYQKWLEDQEQKKTQPKQYIIGKCVHVNGIERKYVKFIKTIDKYQFYALKNKTNEYDTAYIKVNEYLYPICKIGQINEAVNKIKAENMNLLKAIEEHLNNRFKNNQIISLGDAEMFGRLEEAKEHNRRIKQQQEIEERKKQLKEEQKEKQFIQEQNKKLENIITAAEQSIINKQDVKNIEVTEYKTKYEYNSRSLILQLMKKYDIQIPIKTQGWINNSLHSIYYNKNINEWDYRYFKTSKNSTVFSKYLDKLITAIEKQYSKTA